MGLFDDIINQVNPFVRDLVPGFAAVQDVAGEIFGDSLGPQYKGMPGYVPPGYSPTVPNQSYIPTAQQVANQYFHKLPTTGGGASGMWQDPFALTTTRGRGLIPFSGQGPPAPGYRLASRPARAPTAGTQGGMYWVPRRSMNPLNPRALLRAERRMGAFTKWVKHHFSIASAMPRRKRSASRGRFTKRRK